MARWACGLDLGQVSDPSAFAAVEQHAAESGGRPANAYAVRRLERFPLGTPYPDQVARVKSVLAAPPLAGCPLAADQTGVGRAVVDMLRKAGCRCWLRPVTITGGSAVSEDKATGELTVPKKELVGALQVPLSSRLLWVDPATGPTGELFGKELGNFRVKITAAANETYGAWRDGEHDDLVLAVALAVWLMERMYPAGFNPVPKLPSGSTRLVPTPR